MSLVEEPDQMERYPRATAFHEAGHAVVAFYHGHKVVHIHVSDDDESGRTDVIGPITRLERLTFLFAGMAAQTICNAPSKHRAGLGDVADFLNLMAQEGIPDDERDVLRQDAYERANIILHAHRAEVEAVAARLMEHGQMDGPQFLEVMQRKSGSAAAMRAGDRCARLRAAFEASAKG